MPVHPAALPLPLLLVHKMPLQDLLLVLSTGQHGPLPGPCCQEIDGDKLPLRHPIEGGVVCEALQEFKPVQDGLGLSSEAGQGLGAAELGAVQVDAHGALASGDQLRDVGDQPGWEGACKQSIDSRCSMGCSGLCWLVCVSWLTLWHISGLGGRHNTAYRVLCMITPCLLLPHALLNRHASCQASMYSQPGWRLCSASGTQAVLLCQTLPSSMHRQQHASPPDRSLLEMSKIRVTGVYLWQQHSKDTHSMISAAAYMVVPGLSSARNSRPLHHPTAQPNHRLIV
jgi:hypothetical protein